MTTTWRPDPVITSHPTLSGARVEISRPENTHPHADRRYRAVCRGCNTHATPNTNRTTINTWAREHARTCNR